MNKIVMDVNNTAKQFTIPLKQRDTRGVDTITILMLLLSFLAFLYIAARQNEIIIIICLAIMVIITCGWLIKVSARKPTFKYVNIVLLLVAVYWFWLGGMGAAVGILLIIAAALETRVKIKPAIQISPAGVMIKDAFNKQYNWPELTNVIVKEGLITIDSKNNKLFQKEVEPDFSTRDEAEINEFCSSQLGANS